MYNGVRLFVLCVVFCKIYKNMYLLLVIVCFVLFRACLFNFYDW